MTVVTISVRVPMPDGTLAPAKGSLRWTPTRRRDIGGEVILPHSFTVQLVDGAATVNVEPSTAEWAWQVDEYFVGVSARTIHVAVPTAGPVAYTALTLVDPATLLPTAEPEAAWWAYARTDEEVAALIGAVFVVSDTEPTETTRLGVPVVWVDTSTTSTADTTAPSAVGGLTAGAATETTIPLSWTAATDDIGVAGYEYSLDGTAWTSTGSTGTTYTVTGLTAGTSYTVSVRAFDAAGNRGASASVTATTVASADTTAPTAPTNLAGTAGETTMDLSWTASTDAVGVTGYRVSKDNGATWITSSVTGTTYQVTGLTAGTSYTFAVAARDAAGNWSTNATLVKSTTTTAPAPLTQVFLDTFTRPDGTLYDSGLIADSGQTWQGATLSARISGNKLQPAASLVYAPHASASPKEGLADVTAPTSADVKVSFRGPASSTLGGSVANITSGGLISLGSGEPTTITFNNGNGTEANGTLKTYTPIPGFVAGGTYAVKMTWNGATVTVYIDGTRLLEGTYSAAQVTTLEGYTNVQVEGGTTARIDNLKVSA